MTDHTTKLSVTVVIPSKKPNHIANAILKYWAALYGTVEKFLIDIGGEFIIDEFMTLCDIYH